MSLIMSMCKWIAYLPMFMVDIGTENESMQQLDNILLTFLVITVTEQYQSAKNQRPLCRAMQ